MKKGKRVLKKKELLETPFGVGLEKKVFSLDQAKTALKADNISNHQPSEGGTAASSQRPRVFISYSWDSEEYKDWVARLAYRLIHDGVYARIDQWDLKTNTIPSFMNVEVRKADKVLMLCTPVYQAKVYAMEEGLRVTGSGYEAMLVTNEWFAGGARGKFIPVLTRGEWLESVPNFAQGTRGYDLSGEIFNEVVYTQLLRHLYDKQARPPKLGSRPDIFEQPQITPLRGVDFGKDSSSPSH